MNGENGRWGNQEADGGRSAQGQAFNRGATGGVHPQYIANPQSFQEPFGAFPRTVRGVPVLYTESGYKGDLPLSQQPAVKKPQPYE